MISNTDVLIVGAGPTGLMMACQLVKFGIPFRIIDQQSDRSHESRAFGIQAKSMEIFQNLGIVQEFLDKAIIAPEARFFIKGKPKMVFKLDQLNIEGTPFPRIYFVPQSETEKILSDYLASHQIKVERPIKLESFFRANSGFQALLKNKLTGESHHLIGHYLVGCDGAHSTVRHILNIPFTGGEYQQNFFLADAQVTWPESIEPGLMVFIDQKGIFLHAPLNEQISRIIGAKIGSSNKKPSSPLTLQEIEQLSQKITHLPVKIAEPIWKTRFSLHHRAVKHYQQGRAFLAGDAAHIHSPVGAQGMNTGLQDATNLAWKLALVIKHHTSEELLKSYPDEREFIGKKLIKTTDRFFKILTSPSLGLFNLRPILLSLIMWVINRSLPIQKKMFWLMSQLGIHYPANPWLSGPGAGYRAPDAPLGGTTLFELFKEYPFNILIFLANEQEKNSLNTNLLQQIEKTFPQWVRFWYIFRSPENQITYDRYGVSNKAIYFIRPDGYIGFNTNELNLDKLQEYLKKFSRK